MKIFGTWLLVALAAVLALPSYAISLGREAGSCVRIVLADDASQPEQTAARELSEYLGKVTGTPFNVSAEKTAGAGPAIYVGPTRFAAARGLNASAMDSEAWAVRSGPDFLLLAGGRPRGTLYAVYHFLEDVVGVHWWNPWEETVPSRATLRVEGVSLSGKPAFAYRDIYALYGDDGGRFAARNRLNRQGDAMLSGEYGGALDYGPPYHVHTFYSYVPPAQYLKTHPEWFSLIKGERTADRAQLCLTNPELRAFVIERLKNYIESSRKQAAADGRPAPTVFDISQNDWGGPCQCDKCQAIARAEKSEAGPLIDFLNAISDAIRPQYPEVFLDTLAYQYTQKAPKSIRPRDNLLIRLCDTTSNFTKPITDPANAAFREHLLSWAAIAKHLRIWDYAVTYAQPYGLPMPTVQTYPIDYRFYAEHHVEGVFTEHEYPILADLRDFKVWMMMKMLEDPYQDYERCVQTFMDGFYGPAGRYVLQYLHVLEAAATAKPAYCSMGTAPTQLGYLDLSFVRRAQAIFEQAEQATKADPTFLRRVRHARMPLDRATVVLNGRLMSEWLATGGSPETMPVNRDDSATRYRLTWLDQAQMRLPASAQERERQQAEAEVSRYTAFGFVPLPEKFRAMPKSSVHDFTAISTRNWKDIVRVVKDPQAESGMTNRLEFPTKVDTDSHAIEKYRLPMQWGLYDQLNKRTFSGKPIKPEDVPGPGYHWYKMGTYSVAPSYYMYFFWSWIIQLDVDAAQDALKPDAKFDIWASIKFEGPGFPHGSATDKNAICVERVVLVKTDQ
jgi:hypothetical protein